MFTHQNIYGHMDTHTRVHLNKHMSTLTLTSLLVGGFSVFSVKWTSKHTNSQVYNIIQHPGIVIISPCTVFLPFGFSVF